MVMFSCCRFLNVCLRNYFAPSKSLLCISEVLNHLQVVHFGILWHLHYIVQQMFMARRHTVIL